MKVSDTFANTQYERILFTHLSGDTANYVYKRLLDELGGSTQIELINHEQALMAAKALQLGSQLSTLRPNELAAVAKYLNAQAYFTGQVRSGAMAITESTTIHSSIQLDLVDVQSGKTMTSSFVEQTSVSRMMLESQSLKDAATKTAQRYAKTLQSL
ncbi:hypothetical protein ACFO4O_04500 [Glaciecola siphonariae]|uniref:Curli production assembly/transport component CsgG n=1 Tax=Glaciecola siphonariae TaxID=521012 RepID=A0ABV9LSD5_9ALTE